MANTSPTPIKSALRQTLTLWIALLILGGLGVGLLSTPPARAWMLEKTGEEAFFSQVKGLTDLAADSVRPRLNTGDDIPVAPAAVSPFGVNVFLEQEADPAKRALVVQMAADAGFHWLRQEFPWEDIEIHAKGDFEDRRHEPYRSAWDKYDQIVDLAEANGLELIVRLSNPPNWTRSQGDEMGTYAPRTTTRTTPILSPPWSAAIGAGSPIFSFGTSQTSTRSGARIPSTRSNTRHCSKPGPPPPARPTRTW